MDRIAWTEKDNVIVLDTSSEDEMSKEGRATVLDSSSEDEMTAQQQYEKDAGRTQHPPLRLQRRFLFEAAILANITMDLALRATRQATTAMGRSMAAMVVTERHLLVNLADIGKKEKGFLLDAPVSPSELFGTSVETVVENFREAKPHSAAFRTFIPRRTKSEPEKQRGRGPSQSED
ncbi:Catalase-peroxidase [Labeo rohita]|uniref:Catalase-peroxidase n=1 Tax=Labeo rohita TaxID=84645 RepID=A0ABQ8L4N3_LABRO|nr:Catalase-peroxidase [Labeo rohita]